MNRVFSRLGLTAVAIVAGSALYAQSSTTGAVSGVVTDNNGAPLAGATVTLTSAQVTRNITTGADGSFRLGLLNPGTWSVRVVKDGFQPFNSSVLVNTNDVRGLNVKLPSTATTTVEVVGTQSQVDVTSTTQGLQMNMEQMSAVPKGRDFTSMAFFAPGVTDNGGTIGHNDPSISGASGAENSYVLDGLTTTNFQGGFQGASLKTDFIDQVEVQTGGFRPEFSALGGVFNAVTKSGSNDFKGSAWLTWDAVGIHAVAKKSAYGIEAPPNTRYDVGAEVGGAIIKDKLFYFIGVDADINQSTTPLPNNDPGLVGSKAKDTTIQSIGKVNWFLTQDMQLTFFANYNRDKFTDPVLYPTFGTGNLGFDSTNTIGNYNLSYDWSISPSLQLSAKLGFTDNKSTTTPADSSTQTVSDQFYYIGGPGAGNPLYGGNSFTYRSGGTNLYQSLYDAKNTQAKLDLSWFVGNHNLKFGLSDLEAQYTLGQRQGGPVNPVATDGAFAVNYTVDSSGRLNTYEEHTDATVKTVYTGIYAQDTWEMIPGFRLMYGARYEEQNLKSSSGQTFLKFSGSDYIQPRIGFTWDPDNDGKTKVAGSYATYFEDVPQQVSIRVFANEVYLRHRWGAANPGWSYNGGNPTISNPAGYTLTIDYATPFSYDPIANGTKLPQRQEYTLGVDHTLDNGWTLGVHGNYRRLKNVIEDSVLTNAFGSYYDSGLAYAYSGTGAPIAWAGQAILWNPGPGNVTWTARTSPNSLNSGQVIHVSPSQNYFGDKAGNQYQSLNFTASKKTDRDYVNFSYTWSRLEGNYEGLVSSSNGQTDPNITASFDYYPYVGTGVLPLDRTHQVKLQYTHRSPSTTTI
jgi:outer membrane receptor protein involved in Fe transport